MFRFRRTLLWLLIVASFLVTDRPVAQAIPPTDPVPIEPLPDGAVLETFVNSAHNLVAMDFTPDGRWLYTERTSGYDGDVGGNAGYVRVVDHGILQPTPVYKFPVDPNGERGLLGIAVDPNFTSNHRVWTYFTKLNSNGTLNNRVAWLILNNDNSVSANNEGIAAAFPVDYYISVHNGGNLHFGPDGKLYVTVGNNNVTNDNSDPAQSLASPLGKIHRFNPTVPLSTPSDNPFGNNTIYAYGLRNSFDFAFDPISHQLFATENGDACDDEINLILRGGNYGWRPFYPCDDEAPTGPAPQYNTIRPLIYWTPTKAPTGLTFYTGDLFPEWQSDMFMCAFKDSSTALYHFKLNTARTAIASETVISDSTSPNIHCRTDVLTGPDGALYYSQDGGFNDGPIMRITRTSSYIASAIDVTPAAVRAGDIATFTLRARHAGTLSNTFNLTATIPPSMTLLPGAIQYQHGVLNYEADHIWWTGLLSHTETWTATYQVQITAAMTSPAILIGSMDISAPGHPTFSFTTNLLVNGYEIYLPIIMRN
ncbi:MAG TPA: PQQ-dependent sugar dehydrogenase [Anaerolineae bacterium]|nr:PQQ-dependent sugar dehydrogenase [Anaerolineae bacterium]